MSSFMILLYWFSESWQHKIDSFGFRSLWFESGVSCSNDDKASIKKSIWVKRFNTFSSFVTWFILSWLKVDVNIKTNDYNSLRIRTLPIASTIVGIDVSNLFPSINPFEINYIDLWRTCLRKSMIIWKLMSYLGAWMRRVSLKIHF
jgi:hypothetical protein